MTTRKKNEIASKAGRTMRGSQEQEKAFSDGDSAPLDPLRQQVVLDYLPLIRHIARKIMKRLPANIEFDDLISSGVGGLIDAIDKYDPTRDNKFKTYAEFRIRGAILDGLRQQDWVPRSVRDLSKRDQSIRSTLEQQHARPPSDSEVAAASGLTLDEYHEKVMHCFLSLMPIDASQNIAETIENLSSDPLGGSEIRDSLAMLEFKRVKNHLVEAIAELPDQQKIVLSLRYFEDLNLKEIGRIIDVTESRVSQIHAAALVRLRSRMRCLLGVSKGQAP